MSRLIKNTKNLLNKSITLSNKHSPEQRIAKFVTSNQNALKVINIALLTVWGMVLYYFYELRQNRCNCADNMQRDAIVGLSVILMVKYFAITFMPSLLNNGAFRMLSKFLGLIHVVVVVLILLYVRNLEDTNCMCSAGNKKNFIKNAAYAFAGLSVVPIMGNLFFHVADMS